ncbi:MAG: tetratricopeptide repeat protein, partial [Pseudomonadota bacterium]
MLSAMLASAALADADGSTHNAFKDAVDRARGAMMATPAEALDSATAAQQLAVRAALDDASLAEAGWLRGEALTRLNRAEEALPVLEAALAKAKRAVPGQKLHGDLLKAYAAAARMSGSTAQALSALHQAHDIFRDLNEPRAAAIVLQNLGMLHLAARDYDRAIAYLDQADQTYADDTALLAGSIANRGRIYEERGEHDRAIEGYRRALALAREMDSDMLRARLLANIAFVEVERGNLQQANRIADQAIALRGGTGGADEDFLLALKARVAMLQGQPVEARTLIEAAFSGIDLDETTAPYQEAHQTAKRIYAAAGEPDAALAHFTAYDRLKDDATRVVAEANTALMSARF